MPDCTNANSTWDGASKCQKKAIYANFWRALTEKSRTFYLCEFCYTDMTTNTAWQADVLVLDRYEPLIPCPEVGSEFWITLECAFARLAGY